MKNQYVVWLVIDKYTDRYILYIYNMYIQMHFMILWVYTYIHICKCVYIIYIYTQKNIAKKIDFTSFEIEN